MKRLDLKSAEYTQLLIQAAGEITADMFTTEVAFGPLLAGLGVREFIVGFARQDTLPNIASGIMILIYRRYDEGHLVKAAGAFGKGSDMSLVCTTIPTGRNQTLLLPNTKISGM